jgi:HK97 family phage major capsid protein
MSGTDSLLARYQTEIEDRQKFIDGLTEAADRDNRDLEPSELELITRARERMTTVSGMLEPLRDTARIAQQSREMTAKIQEEIRAARSPEAAQKVEYRSAGQYILDYWKAGLGAEEATRRLEIFNRAAAHQTTTDNPGLLPEQIIGPIVNRIDAARPVVAALGPNQLSTGTLNRPRITQHTAVAAQSAEKAELTSQKMTISKVPVTATTYGGYVNISRQDIDWSNPGIMDIVLGDLAAQYSITTEAAAVQGFYGTATAGAVTIPASPTADNVAAAFWGATGQVYTQMKGQGRLLAAASPDVLGILGPLFAPVNPVDAQSTGFTAATYGSGAMGAIGGIPVYVTAGFGTATKRLMVMSSAAAEVYEDRIGALQVVEPSVLGIQVAYAGYFASLALDPAGIIKVTVT